MNARDLLAILPLLLLAATAIFVMLGIAVHRNHAFTAGATAGGFALAFLSLFAAAPLTPRLATPLFLIDSSALFYIGLIVLAAIAVVFLSYGYYKRDEEDRPEELYVLIAIATLGSAVLASADHFASLFLGLEILSVSLYGMVAYQRRVKTSVEAGLKYLVLAAGSASFLLFGIALLYFDLGTMDFRLIPEAMAAQAGAPALLAAAATLILVGIGYKLALVPFHTWTPDVYEGAPAPVTAFVATVSKGAIFALLLHFFDRSQIGGGGPLPVVFSIVAIASMFTGNLLALFQNNVKRILAYSSIAHLGYLMVAFEAGGATGRSAAAFYLVAYFATILGAFGVVTLLSRPGNDSGDLAGYAGLFWRRPVVAGVLTIMLLSLAGIPLTAGFLGKFYLVAAGASVSRWSLIFALVISSTIGLFYYLRIIVALYSGMNESRLELAASGRGPYSLTGTLAGLTAAVIVIGCYPEPLLRLIQTMVSG